MKDRTIRMFKRFMGSEYPLTITELKEEFQLSERTIRNEINEINTFLAEQSIPKIQTIRKRGMYLKLSEIEKKWLTDLIEAEDYLTREERIFDLMLAFALSAQNIFLYQKEAEYQISKSTLDEDMRRVRHILFAYGIEVLSVSKKGIVLKGSERTIRTMVYDIITHSIDSLNFLDDNEQSAIEKILFRYIPKAILKEIDSFYQLIISPKEDIYRNQFVLFTAVWLSRYMGQGLIPSSSWENHEASQNDIRHFVHALCQKLAIVPPVIEINYIVFMLETFHTRNTANTVEWVQAQLLSIQLIQFVEKITKIPFSRKEATLHEGLYKHMVGLISRVKSDIQIINPLKENVKRNYKSIYLAIKQFAPTIEKVIKKALKDDEITFLTIHFSTSVSAINQELSYTYKAVVVCNHGTATGRLLAENLQELFNIEVLAVLSSGEMELIKKMDIDLVFATVNLPYKEKPMFVLDPIIKEESRNNIHEFLEKNEHLQRLVPNQKDATELFYKLLDLMKESGGEISSGIYRQLEKTFDDHQLKINKRELQPMLKDVLKKSNIILWEHCQNWEEAISKVAVPLLETKVIEPAYVEAMIASVKEFGPYIVIGKHLALAHARPEEGVNELGVSVATFSEPVPFGNEANDPVTVIFCLAAVDAYSHLNIMKSLIDLVNDEEKIEQLALSRNVEEFETILYGETKKENDRSETECKN